MVETIKRPITPPPLSEVAQPTTPTNSVQVKLTLPTPPSFAARRARAHSITSPESPAKVTDKDSPSKKKGHNRSVSFNQDVEIKTMSPEQSGRYMIPQRKLSMNHAEDDEESEEVLVDLISPGIRRGPPSALLLGARSGQMMGSLKSPFRGGPKSAPVLPLSQPRGSSRFSSTAAAKGISIAPALAKLKEKRQSTQATGLPGMNSIWSAGVTASGGWITPGLSSARSVSSASAAHAARQRGLSVAVIRDGKEMLVESGPITPGLPSARKVVEQIDAAERVKSPLSVKSPKEVILCRYHHTPGLTCTSRPCRFVHDLSAIPLSPSVDASKLRMLSPTDQTKGTFLRAQSEVMSPTRTFMVKEGEKGVEVEVEKAQPGEVVVLHGAGGAEMEGTVYYMSGGGKGPAGKCKTKFKTVKCRDFVEGFCPYGELCSFIHEEDKPVETEKAVEGDKKEDRPVKNEESAKEETTTTKNSDIAKPRKERPTPIQSAWRKGPPKLARDGLSAFAPPYSTKPILVDCKGDLQTAEIVQSPVPIIVESEMEPKSKSAWSRGPPLTLQTINESTVTPSTDHSVSVSDGQSQEVEILPPTPSFAHLMPPISAWTNYSNDSDPAGPWDPARQKSLSLEYPSTGYQQYEYPLNSDGQSQQQQQQQQQPMLPSMYPWGIPMMPMPMRGYAANPQIPGGPGVLWTPNGWAVQDSAMKKVLNRVERSVKSSGKNGVKAGGVKGYYRKRPCRFFAQGNCPHGDNCTYLHVLPTAHEHSSSDSDTPAPTQSKPTLPCKFYNSQSGCFNGPSCTFLHTLVIPDGVTPVERPRPWRTRPCRHFQLGKCNLGDTCHFAHVVDPNYTYPAGYEATMNSTGAFCAMYKKEGRCRDGFECRNVHYSEVEGGHEYLEDQEEMAARVEELIKMVKATDGDVDVDSDEDDDDDVEIVTADTSSSGMTPV